ncbi:hypothetical protein MRI28_30590 [Nocardiopsis dassonvillei]|uniref:hypothetical protein n=1 Tax=Nocardiopsis dassonvillei TaxID=2014 RepID=UPI00200C84A0|nr:hypothetical protein [Nocardiopsis dassonvillei]MCK9873918.1 hypothetical protein [Nocardiopsis dassonvillei]
MNPLFFEAAAWALSLAGAGLVVHGALSTAKSWTNHPFALVEPLKDFLSKVAQLRREESEPEPVSLDVSPASITLQMRANGHSRLNPIKDVKDLKELTEQVNLHLDHIYGQNARSSTRVFKQELELETSTRELDTQIKGQFGEATARIKSVEEKVKGEFLSAARYQILGSACVVLGLAAQVVSRLLAV